jgi:hypothetical protein
VAVGAPHWPCDGRLQMGVLCEFSTSICDWL